MTRPYPERTSAASKDLLKKEPSISQIAHLAIDFENQPDVSLAVRGCSHLHHMVQKLLKSRFRSLAPEDERMLFDGGANGILSGFSSQLRVAFAAKYLEFDLYNDLMLVNSIRNAFAHSQHPITFAHKLVEQDCKKLALYDLTIKLREKSGDASKYSIGRATFHNTMVAHFIEVHCAVLGVPLRQLDDLKEYVRVLKMEAYSDPWLS